MAESSSKITIKTKNKISHSTQTHSVFLNTSIKLQPDDFKPYTALQINDLPPIITYPDTSFETIIDVATHYWQSTNADVTALQLYTRLDIPNIAKNNFNITILYHTNFIGTLDYNKPNDMAN